MLVLVTTEIKKIHGIHPLKDGMAYNKTHVELMPIRCTDLKIQNDKSPRSAKNQQITATSPSPTEIWASR